MPFPPPPLDAAAAHVKYNPFVECTSAKEPFIWGLFSSHPHLIQIRGLVGFTTQIKQVSEYSFSGSHHPDPACYLGTTKTE